MQETQSLLPRLSDCWALRGIALYRVEGGMDMFVCNVPSSHATSLPRAVQYLAGMPETERRPKVRSGFRND